MLSCVNLLYLWQKGYIAWVGCALAKWCLCKKNNGVGDNTKAQIVASDKRRPQTGVESIKKSFSRVPWSLNLWDPPQVHCILTILASDFFSIFPSHLKERPFQRSLGSAQPIESWNFLRLPLIPSIRKIHGRKNFNPVKNRKRRLDPRDQRTTVRFGLVGWRLVGIPYGLKRWLGPQLKFEIYSNRLGYVCGKTHPTLANAAKNPSPNLRFKFYQLIPSPPTFWLFCKKDRI